VITSKVFQRPPGKVYLVHHNSLGMGAHDQQLLYVASNAKGNLTRQAIALKDVVQMQSDDMCGTLQLQTQTFSLDERTHSRFYTLCVDDFGVSTRRLEELLKSYASASVMAMKKRTSIEMATAADALLHEGSPRMRKPSFDCSAFQHRNKGGFDTKRLSLYVDSVSSGPERSRSLFVQRRSSRYNMSQSPGKPRSQSPLGRRQPDSETEIAREPPADKKLLQKSSSRSGLKKLFGGGKHGPDDSRDTDSVGPQESKNADDKVQGGGAKSIIPGIRSPSNGQSSPVSSAARPRGASALPLPAASAPLLPSTEPPPLPLKPEAKRAVAKREPPALPPQPKSPPPPKPKAPPPMAKPKTPPPPEMMTTAAAAAAPPTGEPSPLPPKPKSPPPPKPKSPPPPPARFSPPPPPTSSAPPVPTRAAPAPPPKRAPPPPPVATAVGADGSPEARFGMTLRSPPCSPDRLRRSLPLPPELDFGEPPKQMDMSPDRGLRQGGEQPQAVERKSYRKGSSAELDSLGDLHASAGAKEERIQSVSPLNPGKSDEQQTSPVAPRTAAIRSPISGWRLGAGADASAEGTSDGKSKTSPGGDASAKGAAKGVEKKDGVFANPKLKSKLAMSGTGRRAVQSARLTSPRAGAAASEEKSRPRGSTVAVSPSGSSGSSGFAASTARPRSTTGYVSPGGSSTSSTASSASGAPRRKSSRSPRDSDGGLHKPVFSSLQKRRSLTPVDESANSNSGGGDPSKNLISPSLEGVDVRSRAQQLQVPRRAPPPGAPAVDGAASSTRLGLDEDRALLRSLGVSQRAAMFSPSKREAAVKAEGAGSDAPTSPRSPWRNHLSASSRKDSSKADKIKSRLFRHKNGTG